MTIIICETEQYEGIPACGEPGCIRFEPLTKSILGRDTRMEFSVWLRSDARLFAYFWNNIREVD